MPSDYKAITEYNEDQLGKDTASRKTQVSMYSDPTHFVYEILQNADDYGATEVLFKLSKDDIVIEHNGEPFEKEHVRAITYFGKSTSREDLVKTGRFGIGFKSVFAFTATPVIISGSEHFQIYGLYRVREYPYPEGFPRSRTRIILPFNHQSEQPDFVEELMSQEEAYRQISECLPTLNMNTLLFTQNIKKIRWEMEDQSGCYSREDGEEDNPRLTTIKDETHKNTYLVFSKIPTWENEEHKPIEIAFAVDTEGQLLPIVDDTLHVLFPTREKTGLRFILNGPYRTNPPRETIALTDSFNIHLLMVTCRLMKELLPKLRDRKLLTLQFLSILPNEEDTLSNFYTPIHNTIIDEFQNEKLTPTKRKNRHASASGLYRDPSEGKLSGLIQDKDLAILLEKKRPQPLWVANLPPWRRNERGQFVQNENLRRQNERIDDFLTTLGIDEWTIEDFIEILEDQPHLAKKWLKDKDEKWHQRLYAFLSDDAYRFSEFCIVRCQDSQYRTGEECHFLIDDVKYKPQAGETQHEHFHYVAKEVYLSGKNKNQQEKAREFLKDIGVCEVDEAERIKAILRQRYEDPDTEIPTKLHEEDMKKFIALVEKEPDRVDLFEDYHIFRTVGWESFDRCPYHEASIIFLDSPYLETGLNACYEDDEYWEFVCTRDINPYLSLDYEEYDLDLEKLGKFAEALGAKTKLEVIKQAIPRDHPQIDYLLSAHGYRQTHTSIDEDYRIPEFPILIANPSIIKSRLVWQAMDSAPDDYLKSQFRWNQSYPTHDGDSTLVHELRNAKWVPQKNEVSISFVRPCDALRDNLPGGFPYDTDKKWLEAIEFGKIAAKQQSLEDTLKDVQNLRNQRAKEWGFKSGDEAEKAAKFFKEQGKSPDELLKKLHAQKRRKELLIIELSDAEEKEYEIRARSIRSTRNKIDPSTTLRALYTTDEDRMHCQMCSKEMPFKKRNSDGDYFEAVEALGKAYFFKEHEAQYLALCPECTAEYKEYVKRDTKARENFHNELKHSDSPQIHLESNGRAIRIWFEDKHWQDLKTVLYYYENVYDREDSDD